MKFLKVIRPAIPLDRITETVSRQFGLTATLTELYSERDQNCKLTEATGAAWVVKIASIEEDRAVIECQLQVMRHIQRVDPTLPIPRVRASVDGGDIVPIEDGRGTAHWLYVLSFLPGDLAEHHPCDASFATSVGRMVARLGLATRGFFHPAAGGRNLLWDVRMAARYLPYAERLSRPASRKLAHDILTGIVERVIPRLDTLRAQIIHGDVHRQNLIVDPTAPRRITGMIDFGDMIHAPLAMDIGSLAGEFLLTPESALENLIAVTAGYHRIAAIAPDEIELIYDLAIGRALLTPLVNRYRQTETPDATDYIQATGESAIDSIEALQAVGRAEVTRMLREACGLASAPKTTVQAPAIAPMLARRERLMGDTFLFYDPPLHMVKGEGMWLTDVTGRRYLDCYNNVPHVGHCHPAVVEALTRQITTLNTNTRYLGEQVLEYAERLGATMTGGLTACAFVNSGSEANDIAWRMARAYTGNAGGLTMQFAYHGITEAVHGFSPSGDLALAVPQHIRTLIPPDDYRGPYKRGEPDLARRYAMDADRAIASLAESGLKPAAFMVDSAFMTNGMLEAPPGYLAAVMEKLHAAGGLLIADEVQSGFGRMGEFLWGYRQHGVQPDIVTIGKPAGNGHPLGVIVTRPEILLNFQRHASFFSTFGGNNVSCAAGLAVLDVIEREALVANATRSGGYLKRGLAKLAERHALIGDARGVGLALGVELVRNRLTLEPAKQETRRLINLVRDEGVLVGSEGELGNIIKIRPPIVFTCEHAEIVIDAMDRALGKLSA
jgi:4-aminobutyrate aminotransferase-like enzyme/Ser/Thr protein kinase RdoA (MazF antagonist)